MNLVLIILIGLVLRLLYLDEIPAEMWGDVIEHYEMTQDILRGSFFYNFRFGGDGPFFSYASALVAVVMRLSFFSLKITTAIGGVLLVILTFYFTLELFKNRKIAYLASFLSAVSFWSLSFSRQAKPHIFVAAFALLALLLLLKKKDILASLIAGIGLYIQAGFWGFPVLLLLLKKYKSFVVACLLSLPLILSFFANKDNLGSHSFFGEKISSDLGLETLVKISESALKNIVSFFWKGDVTFRHNVSGYPHLDFVSSFFFLAGFLLILREVLLKKNYIYFSYFLLPFFVLQIPSVLDIANPQSLPNMGRMIAVMPLAYAGSAYGFFRLWHLFRANGLIRIVLLNLFIFVALINTYWFFSSYPQQLPNRNIPFGRIIAEKIDSYPSDYEIIVNGCCWGDWGQPEPNGIRFRLQTPRTLHFFAADTNDEEISCAILQSQFQNKKVVLFIDPDKRGLVRETNRCLGLQASYLINASQFAVARVVEARVKPF